MLLVENFLEKIIPFIQKLSSEPVEISKCLGRVIAYDVVSRFSLPSKDISNISGYAIRAKDVREVPVQLKKIGSSIPNKVFDGKIEQNEAVFVSANLPVPEGASVIVPEWAVEIDNNGQFITISEVFTSGANISFEGIDVEKGDVIFREGTLLTTRHICQAAAVRLPWLPVYRQPKIGVIVAPEETLQDQNYVYFNSALNQSISSLLIACGAIPINLGAAVNLSATIEEILAFKNEAKFAFNDLDGIVVMGSTTHPNDSLLWATLHQMKAELELTPIKIGPGENLLIGNFNSKPVIGLPTHIIPAMIAGILFIRPMIFKMLGLVDRAFGFENKTATLTRNLDVIDRKVEYLYGYLSENENGQLMVTPHSAQDCLMLTMLNKSDCIIIVDLTKPLEANTNVEIILTSSSVVKT